MAEETAVFESVRPLESWEPFAMIGARRALRGDDRRLFGWVNSDRDRRMALTAMLRDEFERVTGGGTFVEFLKWILENPQVIVAFIEAIKSLFP